MKTGFASNLMKAALAAFAISPFAAPTAFAQSNHDYEPIAARGVIGFSDKTLPLSLEGTSPSLGHFVCRGEIRVAFSKTGGVGSGVAIFQNDKGDHLVGSVSWLTDEKGNGVMTFDWKNSVTFGNGEVWPSTGVFVKTKPKSGKGKTTQPILIKVSIIAVLIG